MTNGYSTDALWMMANHHLANRQWGPARARLDDLNYEHKHKAVDMFVVPSDAPDFVKDRVAAWNEAVERRAQEVKVSEVRAKASMVQRLRDAEAAYRRLPLGSDARLAAFKRVTDAQCELAASAPAEWEAYLEEMSKQEEADMGRKLRAAARRGEF